MPLKPQSKSRKARKWGSFEVRLNDDGTIDEIVGNDVRNFHLEQMDNGCWWLGIMRSIDGQMLHVNLTTKRNAAIDCDAASDDGKICEGFVVLTPEQRARYDKSRRHFEKLMKPMIDEARRSTILGAKDYGITINAR